MLLPIKKYVLGLALALLVASCADTDIPPYNQSSLYVFGDSLSDSGNAQIATQGLLPDKNYYNGRLSNGPNYADQLADKLHTPLKPSREFGSNYAFAGVRSNDVNAQVSNYKSNVDGEAKADAHYIVWSGANDLLEILLNPASTTTIEIAIEHIKSAIQKLSQIGAVNIIVLNQVNLGLVPRITELESDIPGISTLASTRTTEFNTALQTMLAGLAADDDINTLSIDVHGLFETVVSDPASYNLNNISDACYVRDELTIELTGNETICNNSEHFLFWDQLHPTYTGHTIIADEVFSKLP